ncbi:MAG TPA: carboxypeptidase regulatory-like domain-containing protein [Thermoanaerobaculia bacterium]|nr:carboxypeptidase regulatory-like domain-containing protein [Thermoanaerobaculia bacterium]
MTMKRFLTILLAAAITTMIACGGGGETAAYEEDEELEEIVSAGGSATAASGGGAAAAVANAGTITGAVTLAGNPAPQSTIQMGADPACQAAHSSPVHAQNVVVNPAGQLANVFVYVKDFRGAAPKPTEPAILDQRGCQYFPHVGGVQVGQTLRIRNSDPTLHNVHAMPKVNREFNIGQPVQGMTTDKVFDKPEVMVPFKCDVHNWMSSYLAVLPHPYFGTSNEQGSFQIANLPPGTYTLEAWHEKFGTQTQQVTVAPNEQKQVSFSFNAS